jgi:hypothetical protein
MSTARAQTWGVFLFLADLLTLRDGGCLILQLPPQHRWPSEGDRLSLPRLQLVPRGDLLNWRLPTDTATAAPASGPVEIVWREPRRQALLPRFANDNAAVPTVVIDAHGGLLPDPQAWLYRSLSVTDDGLVPPQPPRKPQPSVQEWLVLHERGVIDAEELRQQLGLAGEAA